MTASPVDILVCAGLVLLALFSLGARFRSQAIVLFMVFGFIMALAWLRLGSPDLALAEVALGGGVTGALLLAAARRSNPPENSPSLKMRVAAMFLAGSFTLIVSTGALQLAGGSAGLQAQVYSNLPEIGVKNPVTAVILDIRGFDTILEIAVLMAAFLASLAAAGRATTYRRPAGDTILYRAYRAWMIPLAVFLGLYLVWRGSDLPGGAFQAGTLLGGAAIAVLIGEGMVSLHEWKWHRRLAIGSGLIIFLLAGLVLLWNGSFLNYPMGDAKPWMLVIELGCTLTIGLILGLLYAIVAGRVIPAKPGEGEI
jgi:multisubunit Na+/H+ antiporter MnhB subunit